MSKNHVNESPGTTTDCIHTCNYMRLLFVYMALIFLSIHATASHCSRLNTFHLTGLIFSYRSFYEIFSFTSTFSFPETCSLISYCFLLMLRQLIISIDLSRYNRKLVLHISKVNCLVTPRFLHVTWTVAYSIYTHTHTHSYYVSI